MRSAFDGLHAILGNSGAAVPEVDAAAVEQPAPSPGPPDPPAGAVANAAPTSSSSEFADIPGLSDLDRGIYAGSGTESRHDTSSSLDAFDRGFADSQPLRPTRRPAAVAPSLPITIQVNEREIGGWAAAAVMAFGLVLGATAAIALFHDDVSRIVASWDRPSTTPAQNSR